MKNAGKPGGIGKPQSDRNTRNFKAQLALAEFRREHPLVAPRKSAKKRG